ncbi:MAG: DEAD/DEAH box helicase family protein [Lactobacillus sp.]|nr:DEAD/DEAH box helicase family protein [Lactobacillus sp.]
MSFKDIPLLRYYKTYKNNIVGEFYTPVLQQAVLYQRAVGFFTSGALIDLTKGLRGLVQNHGTIQFIVSPRLSEEDIEAINKGYERQAIIGKALMRDFKEPENYYEEERLNFLAYLIEEGFLDIKVAFTPPEKAKGMYHEKVGIVTDGDGNKIVFTGSLNETINAFHINSESIVVFKSWEESMAYVEDIQHDFEQLWGKHDRDLEILDFPEVLREKFEVMRNPKYDSFFTPKDYSDSEAFYEEYIDTPEKGRPHAPAGFEFRDYQKDAIHAWENNGYRGIFDMATGTGKTYTGLGAVVHLYKKKGRLAVVIVCPYQHLVEQWVEDIELFNMAPTIGYSTSRQRDWKKRLQEDILDFSLGVIDTFCFVTTNATYSSQFVCEQMKRLGEDTLLLVDEAHNFGSPNLRTKLYSNIQYRLALSATLERHGDEDGTSVLKDYFGEKCIEYDLKRAIQENKLTPYYYYPILVYFEEDEYKRYKELSYLISKECHKDRHGKLVITEKGKRLLLQRAGVIAGAKNKLAKLRKLMEKYKDDTHILVYCGSTRTQDFSEDFSEKDEDGERQIVSVSKMLGNELGMKVTHFTSNESAEEREVIKQCFASASPYQAIIAIKCLDEGVNIPNIKTAFILASTTNPKEYIQRRGRVLRLAKDKPYAVIYDFVTMAEPLENVNPYNLDFNCEKALAKRELQRIIEFGEIAKNARDSDTLINDIEVTFDITGKLYEGEEDVDEFK